MQAWSIGKIVRNLKFEKVQGYTLTSLFITFVIVRLWGKTIASATSNHFQGLCTVSKNMLYRTLLNDRIDWRIFLTKITLRFHTIFQEHLVDTDENDTCAILDDTAFQKERCPNRSCQQGVRPCHPQFHLWNKMPNARPLWRKKLLSHRLFPSSGKREE